MRKAAGTACLLAGVLASGWSIAQTRAIARGGSAGRDDAGAGARAGEAASGARRAGVRRPVALRVRRARLRVLPQSGGWFRPAGCRDDLGRIYGAGVLDDDRAVFDAVAKALEVFEQDDRTFYPYSSKYDAYLAGRAALSDQERRGLALFGDPRKGNCASCHVSERGYDGTPPQFTDYGMIALGVPRNGAIPANADPSYHDLGLCGPLRTDLRDRADSRARFRTPTLRNVALRRVFFHNGAVRSLKDAVSFYATRDTDPGRWYPRLPDGRIDVFDDLPAACGANLDTDPPFGRNTGDPPALTETEIDDIVWPSSRPSPTAIGRSLPRKPPARRACPPEVDAEPASGNAARKRIRGIPHFHFFNLR